MRRAHRECSGAAKGTHCVTPPHIQSGGATLGDRCCSLCSVCSKKLHHLCASEHPFLKLFYSELKHDNICFGCSLLVALVEKQMPLYPFDLTGGQLMHVRADDYLRSVALLAPTPFGLGALLATKSLKIVEPDLRMALVLSVPDVRGCRPRDRESFACSFCTSGSIYHNTAANASASSADRRHRSPTRASRGAVPSASRKASRRWRRRCSHRSRPWSRKRA